MTTPSVSEEMIRAATHHAIDLEQCSIFAADVGPSIAKSMTDAAGFLRSLTHLPAGSEAVKPLSWVKRPNGKDWTAEAAIGTYSVGIARGSYLAMIRRVANGDMTDDVLASAASADEAKQYAQDHFARMIATARLAPPSTPPAANVQEGEVFATAWQTSYTGDEWHFAIKAEFSPDDLERGLVCNVTPLSALRSKQAPTVAVPDEDMNAGDRALFALAKVNLKKLGARIAELETKTPTSAECTDCVKEGEQYLWRAAGGDWNLAQATEDGCVLEVRVNGEWVATEIVRLKYLRSRAEQQEGSKYDHVAIRNPINESFSVVELRTGRIIAVARAERREAPSAVVGEPVVLDTILKRLEDAKYRPGDHPAIPVRIDEFMKWLEACLRAQIAADPTSDER